MVNGATASTAAASVLVAANTDRGSVTLLYVSGSPTFLSFGTAVPVVDTGLFLSADVPVITINDQRAREAINGICDTGLTAAGTYVTDVMATIIGGGGDNAASEALLNTIDADTGAILAASVGTIGDAMDSASVDLAAGAGQEVVATPGAGHQLWVYGYEIHANVQGTYQFLSASTAKTGSMLVGAGGGVARDSTYPIFKCTTNEALNITAVTCAADGVVTYRDVTL